LQKTYLQVFSRYDEFLDSTQIGLALQVRGAWDTEAYSGVANGHSKNLDGGQP